jgi:DNA-binding IclR family transcriptional regulator
MCILAFLNRAEQQDYLRAYPLDALTSRTITDAAELESRIAKVRAMGTAQSDGERQQGAGSVAAPIFGFDGQVIGSLSVCGPAYRMNEAARSKVVPHLVHAADQVSQTLGWRGGLPEQPATADDDTVREAVSG